MFGNTALRTRFKYSNSRLMYWVYACVQSKFQRTIKIVRDPLHSRYEVNKHVMTLESDQLSADEILKWFEQHLVASGFVKNKQAGMTSLLVYEKTANGVHKDKWGYCIQKISQLNSKKAVSISPFSHYKQIGVANC